MKVVVAFVGLLAVAFAYPSNANWDWDTWNLETPDSELTGVETFVRVCSVTRPDGTSVSGCCEGWTGTVEGGCLTPVCANGCINGGTCIAPDTCQCLSGFSGTTCESVAVGYGWTDWLSQENDGIGGDDERLYYLRDVYGVCEGVVPSAIECRTSSGIPYDHQTGQVVTCHRRVGLICDRDDQPNKQDCLNYQVRLLCPKSKQKVTTRTCIFNKMEYDVGEVRNEGSCVKCTCGGDSEWECYQRDDPNCGIPLNPTQSPYPKKFNLASVSTSGKCYFNNKEYQHADNAVLDCEICMCDAVDGWQCTPKTCTYRSQTTKCYVEKHHIFLHGHTAKKGCNTCVCNAGTWQCTKMICPEPQTTLYAKICQKPEGNDERSFREGSVVEKDCNTCVCTRGKWDCTEHSCQEQSITTKSCVDVDNKPHPHGATVTRDCNACTCLDGFFKCTHRYCSPIIYHNSTCVDTKTGSLLKSGQSTKHGCNICVCNSGNLTCTEAQCAPTSICFDERNRYDVTNHVVGLQYRPLCNQDGTFAATQCDEFTEICVCVSPLGRVIPGTRVFRKNPDCAPYTASPQVIPEPNLAPLPQLPRLETTGRFPECRDYPELTAEIPDYFQPKCLKDGRFSPIQCNPNTGICYCVSPEGATIPGTDKHITKGIPTCQKFLELDVVALAPTLTPCQEHRHVSQRYKLPYIPECHSLTGEYKPQQCNRKSSQCVCVDKNGVILKGTFHGLNVPSICDQYRDYILAGEDGILPFTVPKLNSQGTYDKVDFTFNMEELFKETTSKCQRQLRVSETIKTVFVPECMSDGAYAPLQCPTSTGLCFCVDMTGAIIPDTPKVSTSLSQPSCEQYRTVVLAPHNLTHTTEYMIITDDIEVGAQVTKDPVLYNKDITVHSCVRQQQIATVVPGVFYPTCQKNGTFHPQQCHPISNMCFCVDRNGVPIQGTASEISQGLPVCMQYWNFTQRLINETTVPLTPLNDAIDQTQRQQRSVTGPLPGTRVDRNCTRQVKLASLIPGTPVPTCEPDSSYTALQCNATTGVCYCSHPNGTVIPDTVTPIILGTPSCWHLRNSTEKSSHVLVIMPEKVKPRHTACLLKQRAFNETDEYNQFFLTYPTCEEDGSFAKVQCNMIRGHCFCVHPLTGEKFELSESTSIPDCSLFEDSTCKWMGDTFNIGEQYYEDCNLCTCNSNNLSACTRMGCDPTKCYANGHAFSHGEVAKKDCNDCTCGENGEWQCTAEVCPADAPKTALPFEPVFERGCVRHGTYYRKEEHFCDRCQECTCIGGNWASCAQTQCLKYLCYHDCVMYFDDEELTIDNVIHRCDNVSGKFVKAQCETEDGRTISLGRDYYKDCNRCVCMDGGEFECQQNQCF